MEKNFDTGKKKKEFHKFTLAGQSFRVYPSMSITYLLNDETEVDETKMFDRTLKFIRAMIVQADRAAFDALIHSEDVFIEASTLLEISSWIVAVLSGSPTKPPRSSGNGRGATATTSKVKLSAVDGKNGKT